MVHRHAHHCIHLLLFGNAEQCSGPHLLHSVLGTDRYLQPHLVRASGYNAGVNSIKFIGDNAAYISKAAGILGVMVVGGLIPSYVSFAFPETLVISSVSVQGIFDSIMPNILPLGFVFLLYWLFKKKNVNTMKLILLVIALSVALSFLGIM